MSAAKLERTFHLRTRARRLVESSRPLHVEIQNLGSVPVDVVVIRKGQRFADGAARKHLFPSGAGDRAAFDLVPPDWGVCCKAERETEPPVRVTVTTSRLSDQAE